MPLPSVGSRRPRVALGAAVVAAALALARAQEPECPSISLADVGVLAAPCENPITACDLDDGCIGAVIEYVGSRIDLSAFDEMPSQDYIAGCIAPFALSDEVTATIPQETLGAMINCDYDAIQARFEADFAPAPQAN